MIKIITFVILLFPLLIIAKENPSEILKFGNSLFQEEDYYRAITEYKRFLYLYPNTPQTHPIEYQIGFSYLKGKKWDAALPYFQKLAAELPKTSTGESAFFSIAQTYFLSQKYDAAVQEWNEFLNQYPKSHFKDFAHYQKGWAYFLQEKNTKAQTELSQIKTISLKEKSSSLSTEISHWDNLPYRSPLLAGLFSTVLPGAGQWYDGRFWDGASALIVNSMFGYGMYATWRDEHYVAFGILTFIASGFYGGNIFSAVSSAYKFNQNAKESTWTQIQKKYGVDIDWNGSSLTFKF